MYISAANFFRLGGECVEECPFGYTLDENRLSCIECDGGACPLGMIRNEHLGP